MKKRLSATPIALRKQPLSDDFIASTLERYGVSISPELASRIRVYIDLLLRWNEKINLTGIVKGREILERHFGESIFAVHAVRISAGRLADVGSGAGFPALPIKLVCSGLGVTLLEPNKRKAAFLAEVCRVLHLSSVEIVASGFEGFAPANELMDYVTSRAVGRVPLLLRWATTILRPAGKVALWLGGSDAQQVSKLPDWRWSPFGPLPGSKGRILLVGSREFAPHR